MAYLIDSLPAYIGLGHLNEKGVREIEFDVTGWLTDYPTGVLSVTYIRPTETTVYPVDASDLVVSTADDADILTWTVSNAVTAIAGSGSVVITLTEGETIVKRSDKVQTIVTDGHAAAGDPPEPLADYVQKWSAVYATVTESVPGTAPTAEVTQNETGTHFVFDLPTDLAADASATTLETGEPATAAVTQNGTGAHFAFGLPRGIQGIQGIQGLTGNGIDNIARTSGDGSPGTTDTYTITFTDETISTFTVYNGDDTTVPLANSLLWRKTASANPVSVYPVPESPLYPKVSGTFTQAGSGDPSPANIRAITPWLASGGTVKVRVTGKNLYDYDSLVYPTNNSSSGFGQKLSTLNLVHGQTYRFSSSKVFWFKISDHPSGLNTRHGNEQSTYTFMYDSAWGDQYLMGNTNILAVIKDMKELRTYNFQLETGFVTTPYEPYSGQEITLTAPQEIPAGWMDNEGKGQATWKKYVFTGDEQFTLNESGMSSWYLASAALAADGFTGVPTNAEAAQAICKCTHYPTTWVRVGKTDQGTEHIQSRFRFRYGAEVSANDFKAYLAAQYAAETPVTVYYQLATPVPLTPTIAPLTALAQTDRITPRQNVVTATPASGIELTYAKSPIQESIDVAAAIAAD